ncbi:hypothetical protein EC968_007464 [Mortierella alpina]|nr:hypothetical protein EC968_007464 [Mortierella alpina]
MAHFVPHSGPSAESALASNAPAASVSAAYPYVTTTTTTTYDEDYDDEDDFADLNAANSANHPADELGSPSQPGGYLGESSDYSALVQPAPSPMPEPYIINQPNTHDTPPFSFGTQLDLISPKLLHDTVMSIVRKNEGMDKRIYPTYELYLEEPTTQGRVFLLRATKRKRSRGSYYAITSDMDNICDYDQRASDTQYGVLGKLRSNFLGTAFNVYSNGRNPFSGGENGTTQQATTTGGAAQMSAAEVEMKKIKDNKNKGLPVRQELGAVIYNPNVLGLKGPRKMTILMNTMTSEGHMVERRPTQAKDTLIGRMTAGDTTDLLVLRNKSPQWNDDTNSFVLNFGGRVSLASVKNFQIVHDNDCKRFSVDYIIMQFGRTSQDNFTMDCQYPMTPFQAFAFALTSFDAKLACE